MIPGGILALDLSSVTGWAYGPVGADRPLCGRWLLPGSIRERGIMFAALDNELDDAITLHQPVVVVSEAPLAPGRTVSTIEVWRQQLGLAGAVEQCCYRRSIRWREQAASTIRAAVLGTARVGGTKQPMLDYCASRGWKVADDNVADACVTWEYAQRMVAARRLIAA
jgi:hypothetical protein